MTTVPEPHEGIDPFDNPETAAREHDETPIVSRAGSEGASGAVDMGGAPASEQPSLRVAGGAAGGSPVAGVTIDDADLAEAVPGDTGPENPGERRG